MAYDINKMLSTALAEEGYLEKKSNASLDSKTANAGSSNWTKYWRDLGYSTTHNAWCQCFVDWVFFKTFGLKAAKELLCYKSESSSWSFYTPTASGYFKNKGQWHTSNPQAGDIIYYKNTERIYHVGIVYKVDSSYIYTIEGNTTAGAGDTVVPNGGGVFKKKRTRKSASIAGFGRPNYGTQSTVAATTSKNYLSLGDKGTEVKEMQQLLIKAGFSCGASGADGDFGGATLTALRNFQTKYGLEVDGKYGPASKAKLQAICTPTQQKYKVTASALNVRKGPGTSYAVIKTIKNGTVITALEEKDGWCRYSEGWVSLKYCVKN